MLTCQVGENIVNTFEYEKEQIRKWSNKGILKCPSCKGKMIYKHGEFKQPHFAHEKSCMSKLFYSHPESEEHMNGKKVLYEWLKSQNVKNLKLESWIPETKQRPDIYFEYAGDRYVIEYQCSPIATKYLERHMLYKLAGIKDIWILGTEKYNFNKDESSLEFVKNTKTIEREIIKSLNNPLLYVKDNNIILNSKLKTKPITDVMKYNMVLCSENIYKLSLKDILNFKKYEDIMYSRRFNLTQVKVNMIKRKLHSDSKARHINVCKNKIYFLYKNRKTIIEICVDKRDSESEKQKKKDYNYIPFFLEDEYDDLMDCFKHYKIRRLGTKITDGNYFHNGKIVSLEFLETVKNFFKVGKRHYRRWACEEIHRQKKTVSDDFDMDKLTIFYKNK